MQREKKRLQGREREDTGRERGYKGKRKERLKREKKERIGCKGEEKRSCKRTIKRDQLTRRKNKCCLFYLLRYN